MKSPKELKVLTIPTLHNAKTYSGIQYIYVAVLDANAKVKLVENLRKHESENDGKNKELAFNLNVKDLNDKDKSLLENVIVMPINPKKSSYKSNTQGQVYGKTYANELKTFINGSAEVTSVFLYRLVDKCFAVIFKDNNGKYRMLFDESIPIELDYEQNTGEGLAAEAGFDVTFKLESKKPAVYLYGDFELIDQLSDGVGNTIAKVSISGSRKSAFEYMQDPFAQEMNGADEDTSQI